MKTHSAVKVTTVAYMGALLPLILIGTPELVALDWAAVPLGAWLGVGFSGLFSLGLAYVFWNYGVSRLGSGRTALFTNLQPPIALFAAWIWLGETLTVLQFGGVVCVLGGVILARRFVSPMPTGPSPKL